MIQLQNSNKDILAKLMATENINVIHKNIPTAYFDVKNRVLACPMLKGDISSELYDLFMGHEVGHALNTPAEGWHDVVSDKGMTFKGYLNVIEDIRIEKKIKDKYPGLRKSFFAGYKELDQMDFFGLKKAGKDISEYGFIDRINLHYKIGAQARVEFSDEEMVYIKRCDKLETFEEVMELALELFENKQEETKTQLDDMSLEDLQDLMDELGIEEEGSESMTIEVQESEDGEDGEEQEGSDAKSDDSDNTNDSDESSSSTDETESSSEKDEVSSESKTDDEGQESASKSPEEKLQDALNKSETDESFRENEGSLHKENDWYGEPNFYDLPERIKFENYIVGSKEVSKEMDKIEFNRKYIKKYVKEFTDNNKKIVNYMVKEFEMKKAAAAYNRSHGAKSGELNMDKLAFYKIKEDIFNRIQVTPEGKNHGVVMAVDWSGSMSGSVRPTVEQAALLAMFCKRIQIPFRVFAFSDSYDRSIWDQVSHIENYEEQRDEMERLQKSKLFGKEIPETTDMTKWSLGNFALLEMMSDKMSNQEFTKALEDWFQVSFTIDDGYYNYNDYDDDWKYDENSGHIGKFNLGGTPLDHTILLMRDYLTEFKLQYGIDVMSFIALTDGSSHNVFSRGQASLVDKITNKTIRLQNPTASLLKWLKETAGVRTIGFYLTKASGNRFMSEASCFSGTQLNSWEEEFETKRKEYNKISTSFTDGHYDLGIVINQKKIDINYNEDELEVKEGANKGTLKRALVKAGNSKMKQRVILNQFVSQMAV